MVDRYVGTALLCVAVVACSLTAATARDIPVPQEFPTITAAMAASSPGDHVVVEPGRYRESDIPFADGVTLIGAGADPGEVVIDASRRGRAILMNRLTQPVVIANLTVTRGQATGPTGFDSSGGGILIHDSEVVLYQVHFVDNRATSHGGALRCLGSSPVVSGCVFKENSAIAGGGGVDASHESHPSFVACSFTGNGAAWGGAASLRGGCRVSFDQCAFDDNEALGGPGMGGGVYTDHTSDVRLSFCSFIGNIANHGGAVSADHDAEIAIENCTLRDNRGVNAGGGLYLKACSPVFEHVLIAFNVGRSVTLAEGSQLPRITATNIFGNSGGDWSGPLFPLRDVDGNMQANPVFCADRAISLRNDSPCLPPNNGVGLVGAGNVGCVRGQQHASDGPYEAVTDSLQAMLGTLGVAPNPCNPRTTVTFAVPDARMVRLRVYDLRGSLVATLAGGVFDRGVHRIDWSGTDDSGRAVPTGSYLMVLDAGDGIVTRKVLILR